MKSSTKTNTQRTINALMTSTTAGVVWTPLARGEVSTSFEVTKKGVKTSVKGNHLLDGKTAMEHKADKVAASEVVTVSGFKELICQFVDSAEVGIMNMVNNPKESVPAFRINKKDQKIVAGLNNSKTKALKDIHGSLTLALGILDGQIVDGATVKSAKTPELMVGIKNVTLYTSADIAKFGYAIWNKSQTESQILARLNKNSRKVNSARLVEKFGDIRALKVEINKNLRLIAKALKTA